MSPLPTNYLKIRKIYLKIIHIYIPSKMSDLLEPPNSNHKIGYSKETINKNLKGTICKMQGKQPQWPAALSILWSANSQLVDSKRQQWVSSNRLITLTLPISLYLRWDTCPTSPTAHQDPLLTIYRHLMHESRRCGMLQSIRKLMRATKDTKTPSK